jgi:DNA mismatch repair protein MutL
MEHMALSHPDISFSYIVNGQTKIQTSGNAREKDLIYNIFGRDITSSLIEVAKETPYVTIRGFIARPIVSRGNRNYENFFVNGRYIKSNILSKALEDGYKGFLMQHQYPFSVLYIDVDTSFVDVNVHPSKMEIRFSDNEEIYNAISEAVNDALNHKELIPHVPVGEKEEETKTPVKNASRVDSVIERARESVANNSPYERKYPKNLGVFESLMPKREGLVSDQAIGATGSTEDGNSQVGEDTTYKNKLSEKEPVYTQKTLFDEEDTGFLTQEARHRHRIIGQLFETYWLVEYEDKLFLIDQHAAHEKVLYERTIKRLAQDSFSTQTLSPPVILTLDATEELMLNRYMDEITSFGYSVSHFGGKEYAIDGVPAEFETIDLKGMFISMLDDFATVSGRQSPDQIIEKVASMSCKAAIKGNQTITEREAHTLIDELMTLDNPYQCPHGRPTIITMSKYEIEKKFKRIV